MSEDANWGQEVTPLSSVHSAPPEVLGAGLPDQTQLLSWGKSFIEGIVRQVVLAVTGVILPGPAGQQLANWALGILDSFDTIFSAFDGIDLTDPGSILTAIGSAIEAALLDIPGVQDLVDAIANGLGVSGTGHDISDVLDAFEGVFGGIDLSGSNPILSAIESLGGSLVEVIEGIFGVDPGSSDPLAVLTTLGSNLMSLLGVPNLNVSTSSFDPITAGEQQLQQVLTPAGALSSLTQIPQHLLGNLNIGQWLTIPGFTSPVYNLQPDPEMQDSTAVHGAGIFDYDGTKSHGTVTGAGSYKVTAASVLRQGLFIPVATKPAQLTDLGIWTSWSGVTSAAGHSICLVASAYDADDNLISDPSNRVVAAIDHAPTSSASYSGTEPISGATITANGSGWVHLTGTYQAPAGCVNVRLTVEVQSTVSAGTVWFSSVLQSLRNGIVDANLLTNLENFTGQFLPTSVAGIGGLSDIGAAVQALTDFSWSGIARTVGSNKSFADLASQFTSTANTADNARDTGDTNNEILAIRDNTSFDSGVAQTEVGTFVLASLVGAADPPNFGVTSALTPISFWNTPDSSPRGYVTWYGKGVTNVTGIFIDLYKLDAAGTTLNYVQSSSDLSGQMGAGWVHGIWIMSGSAIVDTLPGEVYAFAMRITGTGTHTVAGIGAGWMPPHALSSSLTTPDKKAAVRTDGAHSNISMSSITYSGNQMWFGFGINPGGITPPIHQPRPYQYTGPQTVDFAIDSWVKYIDLIAIGAGRGGGGSLAYVPGTGGGAGSGATATLAVGTDITGSSLHIVIGSRGTGGTGSVGGTGGNGGDVTVTATGMTTFTAAGATSNAGFGSTSGADASVINYLGTPYLGGNGGSVGNLGAAPGGGGGGGLPYLSGKDGGDATLWIVYRAA